MTEYFPPIYILSCLYFARLIYDKEKGRLFAFTNQNAAGCHCEFMYKTSDDGGNTWSKEAPHIDADKGVLGFGLGHGIQHR